MYSQTNVETSTAYICPPCNSTCDEAIHTQPGVCSHCNMVLVPKNKSKTIAFYLQDGVEVLDFAGPMEVFAYAGYKVFTVSEKEDPIKSQSILKIIPEFSIENAPKADILAFFGGNASAAYTNPKVIEWVQKQPDVQYHFSVCTGAFILAEAGVLDGKVATTFHDALDNLKDNYPTVDVRYDARFVDNGKVITTAGISAGIDGALHLVAKLQGVNAAKRTAYYMEYDNWQVGDGLLLTTANPYQKTMPDTAFKDFEGTYEYKEGSEIVIKYDPETGLQVLVGNTLYPLYHENNDIFSDVRSEPVFFKRNKANQIIGYAINETGNVFKKLN